MAEYTVAVKILGKDEATKVLSGFKGTLGGLGLAVGKFGKTITAGLGAATTAALGLAASAAPLEGIEAAFGGIAGAAGDELLAALKKGSAGMISQRDLMKSYNQAAQLVNKTFADQLPDAMQYLGKVSAATGEDMGYMLDSLVRGVGRLSPLILDNLKIQVDLTEAYEAYAPTIGKTVEELTKQEQQTALMAQVMAKLAENTAAMPEVAGTAAAGMAQLGAKFQDLKDSVGKALLPVLEAVLTPLADLADRYGPLIVEWVKKAVGWFTALPEPIQLVVVGVGALAAAVTGAMVVAGPLIGVLGGVVGALGSLAAPLGVAVALVAALAAAWATDFAGIRTATTEVIGFVTPFIQEMLGKVLSWVRENWPLIQETISTVLAAVQAVVQAVLSSVAAFWEKHGEAITRIASLAWENIKIVVSAALDVLLGTLKLAMQIVTGDWSGAWQTVLGISDTVTRAILSIVQNWLDMILALFGTSLAEMVSAVRTKFEEAKAVIEDVMGKIISFLGDIDLTQIGKDIMESLKAGIMSKVAAILEAVKEAIRKIIQAAKDALGMLSPSGVFADIGQGMMEGMALGISGNARLPAMAAVGATSNVTNSTVYNISQSIHTRATTGTVSQEFEVLRALYG